MKFSFKFRVIFLLSIIQMVFLSYFSFLLDVTLFLSIYVSVFLGFLMIPYLVRIIYPAKVESANQWVLAIADGIVLSTVIVCIGWLILTLLHFNDPYRIIFWRNLYGVPLISLVIAPFSNNLSKFYTQVTNNHLEVNQVTQKSPHHYLWIGVVEALPFTIGGAIMVDVLLFVLLICLLGGFGGGVYVKLRSK